MLKGNPKNSKNFRRYWAAILSVLIFSWALLLNQPVISLAASSQPTIAISSCQIGAGETGLITITGQNIPSPGIAGYQLSIEYDPLQLEVLGLVKTASDQFTMQIPNCNTPGIVNLAAVQATGVAGDITLARLQFRAKANSSGIVNLKLTLKDLVLADLTKLQAQAGNGQVEITTGQTSNSQQENPLTISIVNLPAESVDNFQTNRLAGNLAAQTAIAIAEQTGWKNGTVILASSETYGLVDALTAGLIKLLKAGFST